MPCVSPVRNFLILPNLGILTILLHLQGTPKGNAHAEQAVGMVKQIYNCCEDPLFGMLILKTVPLLDVKELPDKIFFGRPLHTNLPKPGMVHAGYEDRYINKEDTGTVPSIRNFAIQDPVWITLNEDLP